METVPQHHVHDFRFKSAAEPPNPFLTPLEATFTHESGNRIGPIPGFYDGQDTWIIRFSPPQQGVWRGRTTSTDAGLHGAEPALRCVPNENPNLHGLLGIDPENPQKFAWSDGTPFLLLGFECDWLFSYHQADPERCYRHLNRIAEHGFNTILTNLYAHTGFTTRESDDPRPVDAAYVFSPPRIYPFEGTNDAPDHTRLNPAFFRDFDRLIAYLHRTGTAVHLMLQVQNKQVRWPERRSVADDLFWRYAVARYQAYGNLIWDVGKESKNLLRQTGSHAYTLERMDFIRKHDACGHLVTVHDAEQTSAGRNAEPDRAADFVSDQVHLSDVARYNREAIRRLRMASKPYLNLEYGYELGAENLKTYRGRTNAPWQDVLKWTCAICVAGAYVCYYYDNTSWDLIKFEPEPEGWRRYGYLRKVLDSLPFNRMRADNERVETGFCLAEDGRVYLVFLPDGGNATVDLADSGGTAACEWTDIYSGEQKNAAAKPGGFSTLLENPLAETSHPCLLIIRVNPSV